jgi:hypothetical protein
MTFEQIRLDLCRRAVWIWRFIFPMPQPHPRHRAPCQVDVFNNFYKFDSTTGAYVPIPRPKLEKKIAISHVQTYVFETEAYVAIASQVPGVNSHEYVLAKPGDMLMIWSDGKHKIVPPKAQKWIQDLVPEPKKLR